MSDDGLSYSVATDFDKQMAQAAMELDARTRNARYVPGAIEEHPDSPDILQKSLIDPVLQAEAAYQGRTYHPAREQRQIANRIVSDRGNIWAVDPTSGAARQVVTAPVKPAAEVKPNFAQRNLLEDLTKQIDLKRKQRVAEGNQDSLVSPGMTRSFDIGKELAGLEAQRKQILDQFMGNSNPIQQTNAPVALSSPGPKRYKFNPATGQFH